ncbi:uncharacterized protein LOC131077832 [Cryptomeria japonica]|uniref:uncharacterized protein LOC131077832 n=1 Tax=Cryptomeria japonica TaxID=3369 RepID=UPI0027DA0CEC|nr:uncharacterized protein LOC131077832 [Cryptomeria japonica]
MENQGLASSLDLEMVDPSSLMHVSNKDRTELPPSGEGTSSSKGSFRIKKANGCLERSEDRPVLVIQPKQVLEDVDYWGKHSLICKFLGLRLSLPVLESWARRVWKPEGDMEILLAANNYFLVIFSSIADRNRAFEGGPYFFNQVGLFIKPWHMGFNSAEEIPSWVPVWVRLSRLPLEFWREDILHSISLLLGKPVGSASQTQDRKVISFARICVEVDLNNPLPDSMEICMGSSSWIQQLDYETLPFRCRICHEYGHLHRRCPRLNSSPLPASEPPRLNKGKAPVSDEPVDKEGFTLVKSRNKGKGKKRPWMDRQNEDTFNRFEVLDSVVQEDGIPTELSSGVKGQVENQENIGGLQESQITVGNASLTSCPEALKASADPVKGAKAPPALGLHQKHFKKGPLDKQSRSGRKTDQEKVKIMGDTLVESGQKAVRRLIESQAPDVVFIQETKLTVDGLNNCALRIWPQGYWQGVGALGSSGGVACFWNPRKVSPLWWVSSRSSISMVASIFQTGERCLFSNIYAPTDLPGKTHLWDHINFVRSLEPFLPWILAGDFNVVISMDEKRGGLARLDPSSLLLRDNIGLLNLVDVKPINGVFTWNNRRCGDEAISERLDRFLVSYYWMSRRWTTSSDILDWRGSDHWPIKLCVLSYGITKNPSFKFQLMWLRDHSLRDLVLDWWYEGLPAHGRAMYTFSKWLQYVKYRLKRWNKQCFGNLHAQKLAAQSKLDSITRQIRDHGLSSDLLNAESLALKGLEEWELREEIFWKQKSRIDWLQEGDRNTSFFHNSVKARRQGSSFSMLLSSDGTQLSSCGEISREAVNYFSNLFTREDIPARSEKRAILDSIPCLVSDEMNGALLGPILLLELEKVVFSMKKGKAPGPDGFPIEFFQEFWEIIKFDLLEVVQGSLRNKQMLKSLNSTFLALIPKKEGANRMDQFRPIALCNVVYKIITKLIAERLKPLLGALISTEQGGYVEGRQILDGVVIASEVIHSMASSKERAMFIKLDMAKAYDRVSWEFLQNILLAFGFKEEWVSWVLSCVTSSSFSILINGESSDWFSASRGLWQGDPLSPYLFIIMAEGLGRFIKSQVRQGRIHGWSWNNDLPPCSHLQFVDDTALMGLARVSEAVNFRRTLDIYLKAAGQSINDDKSSIYFFNTPRLIQNRIARILRFQIGSLPLMYLGIPLALGPQRRDFWQGILDKFRSKVSHWTYRWLSSTGRVLLLKTVVQALPIYRCCVQNPPASFMRKFDALSRQFLWSRNLLSSKWSLVKWESVCRLKHAGGLGLRSMALMVSALAAKLYWRWCNNQDQEWAKILSFKYVPGVESQEVPWIALLGKGSCIWDILKKGAQLVRNGLFWICNNGSDALFWLDSWDGHPPILSSFPQLLPLCQMFSDAGWIKVEHFKTVKRMGHLEVSCWKDPQEWPVGGSEEDRAALCKVLEGRLCSSLKERDKLAWSPSPKGNYTVAQGYAMLDRNLHGPAEVPWWRKVWNNFSWPKCNFFLWLVAQRKCLTWENLRKRGFQGPSICVLCLSSEECSSHLFFHCPYSREIWHRWWEAWHHGCIHASSLIEFWESLGRPPAKTPFLQVAWFIGPSFILWNLWLERNRRVFCDSRLDSGQLWTKIISRLQETIHAKCDMSVSIDPGDVTVVRDLSLGVNSRGCSANIIPRRVKRRICRDGRWAPPPDGVLKINTDGSSRGNPGHAGIGGIGRSKDGDVVFCFSVYKGLYSNNLMEALAIKTAVERGCSLGWRRIICESDSQIVVDMLNNQRLDGVSWHLALMVRQILSVCSSLESVSFCHIPREWNTVADCLAKWASEKGDGWDISGRGELPSDYRGILERALMEDRTM